MDVAPALFIHQKLGLGSHASVFDTLLWTLVGGRLLQSTDGLAIDILRFFFVLCIDLNIDLCVLCPYWFGGLH